METETAEVIEPSQAIALHQKPELAIAKRPATSQEMRVEEVNEALLPAYQKAATLELTDAEIEALMAPFPDEIIEIRPHDGLIYISHIHISNRLNKVLKPGKWALVCRRHWLEGNTMYGEYVLIVRGCYVGESVGGHPYQPNNPKVNYSDTLESTAAEALRRIAGKRLSCGSQVWEPEYARQWVANHAHQVGGKWAKKGTNTPSKTVSPQFKAQTLVQSVKTPVTGKPAPIQATAAQRDKMIAMIEAEGPDAIQKALGYFIEVGALLPNEKLTDLPLHWVPTTTEQMRDLGVLIAMLNDTGKAEKPTWVFFPATSASTATINPASTFNAGEDETSPFNALPLAPDPEGRSMPNEQSKQPELTPQQENESWYDVIVPIPHKGQKRDEYLKHPDTIGSLFDARHDDEEARRRLFGFLNNFEPKPWVGRDGKERPPSKSDIEFRKGLDLFGNYYDANHDGERFD